MCQYTHRPKQSDFKLCMVNVNVVEICFIEQREKQRNRKGEGEELRRGKDKHQYSERQLQLRKGWCLPSFPRLVNHFQVRDICPYSRTLTVTDFIICIIFIGFASLVLCLWPKGGDSSGSAPENRCEHARMSVCMVVDGKVDHRAE